MTAAAMKRESTAAAQATTTPSDLDDMRAEVMAQRHFVVLLLARLCREGRDARGAVRRLIDDAQRAGDATFQEIAAQGDALATISAFAYVGALKEIAADAAAKVANE
jgi:hypothetical protein